MRITQEADYALRMMYRLAAERAAGNETIGAATLTGCVAVPTRFGLKILHKLAEAGLVKTSRGTTGGYSLEIDPAVLTMRQIIEAIDGPIALNRCVGDGYDCGNNPDKSVCRLHHVFVEINTQVIERLDRLTLAMLIDEQMGVGDLLAAIH